MQSAPNQGTATGIALTVDLLTNPNLTGFSESVRTTKTGPLLTGAVYFVPGISQNGNIPLTAFSTEGRMSPISSTLVNSDQCNERDILNEL